MSTDQGSTTRFGIRNVYSSPPVTASGPTPGTPTTNNGQYSNNAGTQTAQFEHTALSNLALGNPLPAATPKKYKMCGQDKNTNGLFDTWIVNYVPDFTGSQYAGSLATPLRDIFVCG